MSMDIFFPSGELRKGLLSHLAMGGGKLTKIYGAVEKIRARFVAITQMQALKVL